MEVCFERGANPLHVALDKLSIQSAKLEVCFERGANRRNHLEADSHTSRSKPWFAHFGSKVGNMKMEVCFERGANPRHHRWLGFAPLSKQTSIFMLSTVGAGLGRNLRNFGFGAKLEKK